MRFPSKRRLALVALAVGSIGAVLYVGRPDGDRPRTAAPAAQPPAGPARLGSDGAGDPSSPSSPAAIVAAATDDPSGPLRLEGQVILADESPAAGAEVVIDSRPPIVVTTEADGSFAFTGLLPRRYTLLARSAAQAAGPVSVQLLRDTPPVVLRLRGGGSVEVSVVDERSGAAVAGAAVTLRGIDAPERTTGSDGLAAFDAVVAGSYVIAVQAPGYGPVAIPRFLHGQAGTMERVTAPVRSGVAVRGTVVDESGQPVAGARIISVDAGALAVRPDPTRDGAVSDAKGAWSIPALAPGSYRLAVVHADYPIEIGAPIAVAAAPVDGIEIRVRAGCQLSGSVRTADGQPVAGARVAASAGATGAVQTSAREAVTDEAGRFELAGLAAGPADVIAQASDAAAAPLRVALKPGAPAEVAIVLDQAETIRGAVSASGQAIAEAVVVARPAEVLPGERLRGDVTAIADYDGAFELRGLQKGMRYLLYGARPGQAIANTIYGERSRVTAVAGSRDVRLELAVPRAIRGRVALQGGGAPSLFTVALGNGAPIPFGTRDGSFSLRELAAGEYRVRIEGPSFERRVLIVDVPADRDAELGVVEVNAGRRLTGVVTGASGEPVAGARVVFGSRLYGDATSGARVDDGDDLGSREATTGPDGGFSLSGLGDGAGVLIAEHAEHGRSRPIPVPAGSAEPLTIALRPTGTIEGRVVEDGRGVAGVTVMVNAVPDNGNMLTAATDSSGAFSVRGVSPGRYSVAAAIPQEGNAGSTVSRPVEVRSGAPAQVELVLPSGGVTLLIDPQVDGSPIKEGQLLLAAPPGVGGDAVAVIGEQRPIRLERVQPGTYRGCVIPALAAGRVLDADDLRRLKCRSVTVAETPAQQSIVLDVPAAPI